MSTSGQELGEQAAGGGGGLFGDVAGGGSAVLRENLADHGDIGGFGENFTVFASQMGVLAFQERRGQVGGVGFDQKPAFWHIFGIFGRFFGIRAGQSASKGEKDVFFGEGGEGVGGAGVGVDEESGGMRGQGEEDVQHRIPGVAAVEAGGKGELIGKVELGPENGFAVGVEVVAHAGVEADFADTGGAVGEGFAEVLEPTGAAALDEPGVDAERAEDAGVSIREGVDGRPIGLGGGVDVEQKHAGGAGAGKDLRQMGGQSRVLQVAVGVGPCKINRILSVPGCRRCYAHPDMLKGWFISVNPQKWRGAGLALLLALVGAGCSTFSNYPQGMEATTLTPLKMGQKPDYQKTFGKRTTQGKEQVLFSMEMGRTAQLEGDVEESRKAFAKAIAATREQDEQAVLAIKGAAAQTAAVLVNDKAIPYRASSYERTLVHHYQALNYLASNDLVGAGVEVRLANREQGAAQSRHQKEVDQAKSKNQNTLASLSTNDAPEEVRDPRLSTVYAGLDQMAGSVKYSFQNAATFYVSAVIWEMLGERNDAYIDYKKALEIYPDNPFLQQDVVRIGKRLGMREDLDDYAKRFPEAAKTPVDGGVELKSKARLVVVYEEGLVAEENGVLDSLSAAGSGIDRGDRATRI